MIYYLDSDNAQRQQEAFNKGFTGYKDLGKEDINEIMEIWKNHINFIEQLKIKDLEEIKTKEEITERIKQEASNIIDFVFLSADKKTEKAFKRSLNLINEQNQLLILTEKDMEPVKEKLKEIKYNGGYSWNAFEVSDRLYFFPLSAYKDYFTEILELSDLEARNIIYSAIYSEITKRPYIIPDTEANYYYHGPATDLLTLPGKTPKSKTVTRNGQEIRIIKKIDKKKSRAIQLTIPEKQIYKNIALSENQTKISIYLDMLLTAKFYSKQKIVNSEVPLTINYEDFIKRTQGLDKTQHSYRTYKSQLKKDLKELAQISVEGSYKEKGIEYYKSSLINDIILTDQDTAHLSLNKLFATYLLNSTLAPSFNLLELKKRDFEIARKLIEYGTQPNNIARGTHEKLKVINILKNTKLPAFEDLTQKKQWRNRIKNPFEKSLNNLVTKKTLTSWHYLDRKGNQIDPKKIKSYDDFKNLYVIFKLLNKTDYLLQLEEKAQNKD